MHVVRVCCYRRFASLDSTASWRGCPMQSNATLELPFDRHKVVMDITFAAWCEVKKSLWSGFCVKLWMLCFVFDMSERMSKDMSERCQKECQKICQKACQRMCQKECQKICQKECQKICQKECKKKCQKERQKRCQKECQKNCQKDRQKIASGQSAKLRATQRVSGDELHVYPHLTRSG